MDTAKPAPAAPRRITVHAPAAGEVRVFVCSLPDLTVASSVATRHDAQDWTANFTAAVGDQYWIEVDGGPPLLDPSCFDVQATPQGPRSVMREPWAQHPQGASLATPPIVYELHTRGFGRTFRGCIDHLDHVAGIGVNVIELMPVHPFDTHTNYWGYMPLVWGAVHREYAEHAELAAEELAELVAAAHQRGMHVWLDVVFNHTGEGGATMPTLSLRGLDDEHAYRHDADGTYTNDSGCGNDIDAAGPYVRHLVMEALGRYADLGIDGFRFDLASLLTRDDGTLVRLITEWAARRGIALIAEPWDLGSYQLGSDVWPRGWLQWNDRFRDDVRGFLRGETGLVAAVRQRVQGSPDLFEDGPGTSVNFVTAHDGLTLHDLTIVTSDRHRSWDTGSDLRLQQMMNHVAVLLLSAGTPMWVMGDEFARSQQGHDNPYDIDGPLTWVDWAPARAWQELTDFIRLLLKLRGAHPPSGFRFYGAGGDVDESPASHSIAWCAGGLYVMVNAWWEQMTFEVQEPGEWRVALATSKPLCESVVEVTLAPRSMVVLRQG